MSKTTTKYNAKGNAISEIKEVSQEETYERQEHNRNINKVWSGVAILLIICVTSLIIVGLFRSYYMNKSNHHYSVIELRESNAHALALAKINNAFELEKIRLKLEQIQLEREATLATIGMQKEAVKVIGSNANYQLPASVTSALQDIVEEIVTIKGEINEIEIVSLAEAPIKRGGWVGIARCEDVHDYDKFKLDNSAGTRVKILDTDCRDGFDDCKVAHQPSEYAEWVDCTSIMGYKA